MKRRQSQQRGQRMFSSLRRSARARAQRRLLFESLENRMLMATAPVALNDAFSVTANTALEIAAAGVLANDSDADGNTLSAVLQTGPAHGSLTLNANGSFSYVPNTAFTGSDSFTYRAHDGALQSAIATVAIDVTNDPALRTGVVANVGSSSWTKVTLDHSYKSMVVVLSPNYSTSQVPVIARVRNASGNSFEVQVQRADNNTSSISGINVHYTVVEEGVYNQAQHGVTMEAVKFTSTVTDNNSSWVGQRTSYHNTYVNPVVVGQVMTANDGDASVFWARGASSAEAPSATNLYVGKHVGEDTDRTRNSETLGYIVIEKGQGSINGVGYVAQTGPAAVTGAGNGAVATYPLVGFDAVTSAVVTAAGMGGPDGGWAVLAGTDALSATGVKLFIDEDQWLDTERVHLAERVSCVVFGTLSTPPEPNLRTGTVTDASSSSWKTVTLDHSYKSMVVVLSPSYSPDGAPLIARVRNAAGNSFQLQVQRADGSTTPVSGVTVHYTVVEEGVYNQAEHGVTMEAVKFSSTVTDSSSSWLGQQQSYLNSYTNPVVVGQVMTANDLAPSVFWARGANAGDAPSGGVLYVGKHVGEHASTSRVAEQIGYIVLESGSGSIDGVSYVAQVGAETVVGATTGAPVTYPLLGLDTVTSAVVSAAGMNGGDGGWAVLAGSGSLTPSGLKLFFDEDQWRDAERNHISEQVAYIAFGTLGEPTTPNLRTGTVTDATSSSWKTVTLDHTYKSMVVVLSPSYNPDGTPLIARVRNASGNSFQLQVQRADGSTAPVSGVTVHYTVVEEGVYNQADHGVTMEAVKFASTVTDSSSSWLGQQQSYHNSYTNPVVVGQVMTANDAAPSVFWARGAAAGDAPSRTSLYVGKHVGEHASTSRVAEQIGYIVIESGTGTIGTVGYVAQVGAEAVVGPTSGAPANYPLLGLDTTTSAIVSGAGMNGPDGGWAVLAGSGSLSPNGLKLFFDEDQWRDTERGHLAEQVSYVVFGTLGEPPTPNLRTGSVQNVRSDAWTTVTLDHSYKSMVVVATASYEAGGAPLVTRVRNAAGDSFQVQVQRVDGVQTPVSGITVHYTVVDEGVYNQAEHGAKLEAVKLLSTTTDSTQSWLGQRVEYSNSYASPVVLGQVMSANDLNYSVFWARGATTADAPSASQLYVGKHVGEDANTTRVAETVGYIVLESGVATVSGVDFVAGVGAETVVGTDNGIPVSYSLTGANGATHAVATLAGMRGPDGGWAVVAGDDGVSSSSLQLFVEEDQLKDTERMHLAERVAYVVFTDSGAPVAANNSYTVNEDTTLNVAAAGVLSNDSDPNGDTLTAVLVNGPSHGTLTLNSNGSFSYRGNANYFGSDAFTYRASDGGATSNIATVSITVNAVNDAPVAAGNSYSVDEDTTLTVSAPGVLGNDSDVEGSALTAVLGVGPSHGTLTLNSNGSFSYRGNANYFGSDSFTYRARDGQLNSALATVSITVRSVNDAPVAAGDSYGTTSGETLVVSAASGVLANDSDVEGSALTASLVSGPSHGTLTLNSNGSFSYTAAAGWSGNDAFTYRANDGSANSGVATVTIVVAEGESNTAPVAVDDSYSMDEKTTLAISAPGLLSNDSDANGDTLTAALVSGPSHGTLTLNANGSFSYTPETNFTGTDTFTYRASDGSANSNLATVSVTVSAVSVPIPELALWESHMLQFGAQHAAGYLDGSYGLAHTYYDAQRVFQQIAEYTGDPSWLNVADRAEHIYRDTYVMLAEAYGGGYGAVPGYWSFTHGLARDYLSTGDTESKNAVIEISRHAAYAADSTPLESTENADLSREVAYAINSYINAELVGDMRRERLAAFVEQALGHMDQWFVQQSDVDFGPFMFGLTAEALIYYWDHVEQDARILQKLQLGADWIWDNAWIHDDEAFYYRADNPTSGSADLNMLISPVYSWLYLQTGNTKYRDRGDQVFAGGVKGSWLDGSKQFNQNYRWSFDYLQWRYAAESSFD